jgi:hypothetical protein
MNTPVIISVISAAANVIVAAISFYLAKKKEGEADWRKHKYEQYKEFLVSSAGLLLGTRLLRATECSSKPVESGRITGKLGLFVSLKT